MAVAQLTPDILPSVGGQGQEPEEQQLVKHSMTCPVIQVNEDFPSPLPCCVSVSTEFGRKHLLYIQWSKYTSYLIINSNGGVSLRTNLMSHDALGCHLSLVTLTKDHLLLPICVYLLHRLYLFNGYIYLICHLFQIPHSFHLSPCSCRCTL